MILIFIIEPDRTSYLRCDSLESEPLRRGVDDVDESGAEAAHALALGLGDEHTT